MKVSDQYFVQKETGKFPGGKLHPKALHCAVLRLVFIFFLILFTSASHKGWSATAEISSPQRIISMSPGITEILFALGLGDQVVGVTNFCVYPEKAKSISRIGSLLNPSYETIITLKPDLIIHQPKKFKIETIVEKLGIRNLSISMLSLDEIFNAIKAIGLTTKRENAADRLIQSMKEKIDFHRKRLAQVSQKSVLLILGISNDSMRDLYGVGPDTYLGEMLALAGGRNILEGVKTQYPKISKEFIIYESPEIIIEVGPKDILSREASKKRRQEWEKFSTIRAIKNKNIHFIGTDYVLIPGPRLINIIDDFVKAIHPEISSNNSLKLEKAGELR